MHVIIKGNGIIINMSIQYYFTIQQYILSFGKITILFVKLTCCPVDVCLGVLIILVYYTVLLYTCDRYLEHQLCPQRNLAFQLHLKRNTAGRNVHKI